MIIPMRLRYAVQQIPIPHERIASLAGVGLASVDTALSGDEHKLTSATNRKIAKAVKSEVERIHWAIIHANG